MDRDKALKRLKALKGDMTIPRTVETYGYSQRTWEDWLSGRRCPKDTQILHLELLKHFRDNYDKEFEEVKAVLLAK